MLIKGATGVVSVLHTSYLVKSCKVSKVFRDFQSAWNLTGVSTAPLSNHHIKRCEHFNIYNLAGSRRCKLLQDGLPGAETGPWGWFNINRPPYQYSKSHCGDKTILRSSSLHNGIYFTGKMASLHWTWVLIVYLRNNKLKLLLIIQTRHGKCVRYNFSAHKAKY